jgi:hypothetical protein
MVTALLPLAAEAAAKASKTPFYLAGAVLVVFALAVSAAGLRSETFAGSRGARTGLVTLAGLLVAAAMATAVLTA